MNPDDIGRDIVVIVSENETVRGKLSAYDGDLLFEVTDRWGNVSEWNRAHIRGVKWKD